MESRVRKHACRIVVAMMAMLAWGPQPAFTGQEGAGIWVYNSNWSLALVNLTDYPLTYLRAGEPGAYPYPSVTNDTSGCGGGQPMLEAGTDWQVEPFRTKMWLGYPGCRIAPVFWSGKMTLYSTGFPEWAFDLVFIKQRAEGVLEYGNWIGLSPHGSGQGWSTNYNNWAYYRWVTPVNDNKMHNVMTLIGPKVMVALYSPTGNHLVVVVQQLYEWDAAGTVWDDAYAYRAVQLDFVDNSGHSVPGQ